MASEIERKWLWDHKHLTPLFLSRAREVQVIKQGYIATEGKNTVRIRELTAEGKTEHIVTIKGPKTSRYGRDEYEFTVGYDEGEGLFKLCESRIITKTRILIDIKRHILELDIFSGKLEGLVIAEVEFKDTGTAKLFKTPEAFGIEVTDDKRFTNKNLSMTQQIPLLAANLKKGEKNDK